MNIIADSSVWFEYFKRHEPWYSELQAYLDLLRVRIIDPVVGEILQGALNQHEVNFVRKHICYVPKLEIINLFEKAGEYSYKNKLVSKGIGLIDASLIVATLESGSLLWTLDRKIVNYLDKKYLHRSDLNCLNG